MDSAVGTEQVPKTEDRPKIGAVQWRGRSRGVVGLNPHAPAGSSAPESQGSPTDPVHDLNLETPHVALLFSGGGKLVRHTGRRRATDMYTDSLLVTCTAHGAFGTRWEFRPVAEDSSPSENAVARLE